MTVQMNRTRPVSEEDVTQFERVANMKLPAQFREFLLKHNGAQPEDNVFSIPDGGNQSGVNGFVPLKELLVESSKVHGIAGRFIAVAWAEGGNYVCLSLDLDGEVLFWDHEQPSLRLTVAYNWDDFLLNLQPFDANSVNLRPDQVKKSWIDPEFLKNLKKES